MEEKKYSLVEKIKNNIKKFASNIVGLFKPEPPKNENIPKEDKIFAKTQMGKLNEKKSNENIKNPDEKLEETLKKLNTQKTQIANLDKAIESGNLSPERLAEALKLKQKFDVSKTDDHIKKIEEINTKRGELDKNEDKSLKTNK